MFDQARNRLGGSHTTFILKLFIPSHLLCNVGASKLDLFDLLIQPSLEEDEVRIVDEKHYRLVPADQISPDELRAYGQRG